MSVTPEDLFAAGERYDTALAGLFAAMEEQRALLVQAVREGMDPGAAITASGMSPRIAALLLHKHGLDSQA